MNIRKETARWIAVWVALALLFAGVVTALVIAIGNRSASAQKEKTPERLIIKASETEPTVMLSMGQAKVMNAPLGSAAYVSQTVTATITPSTVADKYVTWSVVWAADAPLKTSDISEYLQITDDSQGNLTATLNCYKAFRGSKAVLSCTTRQGGKTGTCEVVYEGVPSSMTINPPSGVTQDASGNHSMDMLYVGKNYSLNFSLDNLFHDAGTNFSDYAVTVSGVGTVTCGTYVQSRRGAGWNSHDHIVDFGNIAGDFISATITGNTLNIGVTKSLYDYYESAETKTVEGNGETTTYTNKLYALNTDANGDLPYLVITVRHRTLGFSASYSFMIGEEVSNVAMSSSTVRF